MENKEIENIVKAMKAKRRDEEINLFGHTIHTQTMTKNKKKFNRNSKHKKNHHDSSDGFSFLLFFNPNGFVYFL